MVKEVEVEEEEEEQDLVDYHQKEARTLEQAL